MFTCPCRTESGCKETHDLYSMMGDVGWLKALHSSEEGRFKDRASGEKENKMELDFEDL